MDELSRSQAELESEWTRELLAPPRFLRRAAAWLTSRPRERRPAAHRPTAAPGYRATTSPRDTSGSAA